MPIYEYQCASCHHHFEEIQRHSDPPVAQCPKCQGAVNRLISQTRFALKGEGWYKDGYAKPAPKANTGATAKSETGTASKTESGGTAKSETPKTEKPAEKAAPTSPSTPSTSEGKSRG